LDTNAFKETLAEQGFDDVQTKSLAPGFHADEHDHPFDVRALVVNGEMILTVDGHTKSYREGEVFVMAAGCPHQEAVGSEGVSYIVGKRHPAC
jgi:quercetin dioxygenase-like cupin family protein